MKRLFWILFFLVVLPTVLTPILLKFTIQPVVNWLLQTRVNAPAYVKSVETNWLLTELNVQDLEIEQPPDFGKGPMLVVPRLDLKLDPSTYWKFDLYGTLQVTDLYLHYKEKNGISNIARAFGLQVQPSKEEGSKEFQLKRVNANVTFNGLSDIKYSASGIFEGFHNNARFAVNGTADANKKETVADFKIFDWILRHKIIQTLTGKPEIVLTKIDGRVKISEPWLYFVDRNTKLYTVGDVLFAEIYKNSKYNYITKELDIKGALYLPVKTEFTLTGTADNPKIKIKGIQPLKIKVPSNNLLKGQTDNQTQNLDINKIKQNIDKAIKESTQQLRQLLKGLFQ